MRLRLLKPPGVFAVLLLLRVMRSGMRLVVGGIALGTAMALVLTPLLRSLLVGVRPADPLTIGLVIVLFLAIAAIACFMPTRRAIRIDPTTTLRFE